MTAANVATAPAIRHHTKLRGRVFSKPASKKRKSERPLHRMSRLTPESMSARHAVITRGKQPVPTRSTARTDKSIRRLNQAFKGVDPGCDSTLQEMHRMPAQARPCQIPGDCQTWNDADTRLNLTAIPRLYPFTSKRFHALLNSLFKVLFNFPSRYLFAIGLVIVFSLRWSLPPALGCILKQPDSKIDPRETRPRR